MGHFSHCLQISSFLIMDHFLKYGVLIFVGGSLLVLEIFFDAKERKEDRSRHISRNLVFGLLSTLFVGLFYTSILLFAKSFSDHYDISGLLSFLPFGSIINFFIIFLLFDLVLYLWHLINHKIPFLWRFHQVHHSDADLDFSSAVRFHVGELLISAFVKAVFLILTGASVAMIAALDVLVTLFALYNHANLSMGRMERLMRWFIVTPDMHRIHHSKHLNETNSNYTTILSIWDKAFGTYTQKSLYSDGVGLNQYEKPASRSLMALLMMPFRRKK